MAASPGKDAPEKILPELAGIMKKIRSISGMEKFDYSGVQIGSAIFAVKPGDGSAREQAASCQRVLGGSANFAREYATKRYRSNLINWGILPFILEEDPRFKNGDYVFIPGARSMIIDAKSSVTAYAITADSVIPFSLSVPVLTQDEQKIVLDGCLINFNRNKLKGN